MSAVHDFFADEEKYEFKYSLMHFKTISGALIIMPVEPLFDLSAGEYGFEKETGKAGWRSRNDTPITLGDSKIKRSRVKFTLGMCFVDDTVS